MAETQTNPNTNVVEEQRIINEALTVLIESHRNEAGEGYPMDFGVNFLCQYTILNHHEPVVRKAWGEFYEAYSLGGDES